MRDECYIHWIPRAPIEWEYKYIMFLFLPLSFLSSVDSLNASTESSGLLHVQMNMTGDGYSMYWFKPIEIHSIWFWYLYT